MKKTVMPAVIVTEPKRMLAARAEQAVLERLPVDRSALRAAAKLLEPKRLKLVLLAAAGGMALVSMIGSLGHERLYRAAVARELKKQLAPVNERLETLQKQNEELKRQNDELRQKLG